MDDVTIPGIPKGYGNDDVVIPALRKKQE